MSRIGSSGIFLGISMDCWSSAFFGSVFANAGLLGTASGTPSSCDHNFSF
jgi:hypothetical protein